MMKVGIIGGGVVGSAIARSYIEHVREVRIFDTDATKTTHTREETLDCDVIFICLPTPGVSHGLGVSNLLQFFLSLKDKEKQLNFVLKSTVPIGFTRQTVTQLGITNLVHSPEFITARCAYTDAQLPIRNMIGSSYTGDIAHYPGKKLLELFTLRFPHTPTYLYKCEETEAIKLFLNSFFAVKVTLFNELNLLATKLGLDWSVIHREMLRDGRIHPSHSIVPGPDTYYGYGGSCLPKDLKELVVQEGLHSMDMEHSLLLHSSQQNITNRRRGK